MKAYFDFMAGGVDKMVDKNSGRYLYRKRGVFYFSRHVPIDMRAQYGCPRIVFCLKTKSGDAAVKGSQALAQKLDDYWLSLSAFNRLPFLLCKHVSLTLKKHR